ncbi:MAG: MnhB domain-containing protein [Candidatus Methylacidiphilales bacterium]
MKTPTSFILRTAAGLLFFLVNVMALYLLLRGHNYPGGGFIAGLASAMSIVLLGLAVGFEEVEKWIRIDMMQLAAWGLLIALLAAMLPLLPFFPGQHFFEHKMFHLDLPIYGTLHVGTTLVFDIGVLMVVVGISTKVVMVLSRSTSGQRALNPGERSHYSSPVEGFIEEGHEDTNDIDNEVNRP